jgi:predicted DNA-binding protein
MNTQMIIRIDPAIKDKLALMSKAEGKSASQMVRGLIEDYIREHDPAAYIDDLWSRLGRKLEDQGIKPEDIPAILREVRTRR